jgi:hypothetical protein
MIALDSIGNWGIHVDKNSSSPTEPQNAPLSFLCDGAPANEVSFGPNNQVAMACAASGFFGNLFLPVCLTSLPSAHQSVNFAPGDVGYSFTPAIAYQPAYEFGPPIGGSSTGYYSMDTTDVVAVGDIEAQSTTMTNLGGGIGAPFWFYWLPVGMNITVDGAGEGGGPLVAQVVSNDGHSITLDTPAKKGVQAQNIHWQSGTVQPCGAPGQTCCTNALCDSGAACNNNVCVATP